jgi:hypothetical protein
MVEPRADLLASGRHMPTQDRTLPPVRPAMPESAQDAWCMVETSLIGREPQGSGRNETSRSSSGRLLRGVARLGQMLSLAVVLVALAFTLAFVLLTFHSRLPDGVEGALLNSASRVREHRTLWVNPVLGAWDYGPVPSRYYVPYTGLWACVLSVFPASLGIDPARAIGAAAWFGLLIWIVAAAPPARRRAAAVAAAFVAGAYTLTLYGGSGRPDSPALLLAGIALWRTVRNDRAGAVEGALFAIAALIKPSVLGIAAGTLSAEVFYRRVRAWPAVLGGGIASAALVLTLDRASHGQWLEHLTRSNYGGMQLDFWLGRLAARLPFFGLPLAFATFCAYRARAMPGAKRALWALASAVGWTLFTLAKAGSASNYWMEPCVAAVVIFAHVPLPRLTPAVCALLSAVAPVQALWTGLASIRSSIESVATAAPQRAMLEGARARLGASPDQIVLGAEAGLEFLLNGRIVQQPVYMTSLSRVGRYPLEVWMHDLERPQVVGLLMNDDLLERPPSAENVSDDLFAPALRSFLRERYVLVQSGVGLYLYARRGRPPS